MEFLDNKIKQLGTEADVLVQRKMMLENELNQIENRLTQLVGAITEINKLKEEQNEVKNAE